MKFIFELNHPKHYYQFKYIMSILENRGHSILVLARDKDVLLKVLQEEGVPYRVFGVHKESISGKVFSSFSIFRHYKQIAKAFSPDVIVSKASLYGTLVAKMLGCKSFIFPGSEVVKLTNNVVAPMATWIVTPEPFTYQCTENSFHTPESSSAGRGRTVILVTAPTRVSSVVLSKTRPVGLGVTASV